MAEADGTGEDRRNYTTTTNLQSGHSKHPKRNSQAQGRKYASRACVQCRKKKRRCDGDDCTSCAREGIVCVMDLDTDQRRQINRNNRNSRDRLPEKLLLAIRSASLTEAQSIFDAIRQDAPTVELESMVEQLELAPDELPTSAISDGPGDARPPYGPFDGWKATPTGSEMSFALDRGNDAQENRPWEQQSSGASSGRELQFGSASDVHTSSTHFRSDRFDQVMLSFREAASSQIAMGAGPAVILSMDGLDLELLFRNRMPSDPHTISTWACEMVKSYTALEPVVQLALVYFAGTFMRWLILPCRATYTLMSKIMRPLEADTMVHDAAELEFCRHNGLKWLSKLTMNSQQISWPYPYASCMLDSGDRNCRRLSDFFMNHCDDSASWQQASV